VNTTLVERFLFNAFLILGLAVVTLVWMSLA
jgi:hypothetical protein